MQEQGKQCKLKTINNISKQLSAYTKWQENYIQAFTNNVKDTSCHLTAEENLKVSAKTRPFLCVQKKSLSNQ